jgi:2-dehydro-3-deoxy-D-arabinonate dehydratase
MKLTRHETPHGPRWAADALWLVETFELRDLLAETRAGMGRLIQLHLTDEPAHGHLLAPIEAQQEVWASGVTYQRSREARQAESTSGSVYDRVYSAQRPELFFKAPGWRVAGHLQGVRFRADSAWNVPEPELTLVINRHGEIAGYTAGNDLSSRSIEGENPLYLPQAKVYNASCALGQAIDLDIEQIHALPVSIRIERAGREIFQGSTSTANMNRRLEELVAYLYRELSFPYGSFLMTGTGIVPPEEFSLQHADKITISVGEVSLSNPVRA